MTPDKLKELDAAMDQIAREQGEREARQPTLDAWHRARHDAFASLGADGPARDAFFTEAIADGEAILNRIDHYLNHLVEPHVDPRSVVMPGRVLLELLRAAHATRRGVAEIGYAARTFLKALRNETQLDESAVARVVVWMDEYGIHNYSWGGSLSIRAAIEKPADPNDPDPLPF
jgi:hypothetical protein